MTLVFVDWNLHKIFYNTVKIFNHKSLISVICLAYTAVKKKDVKNYIFYKTTHRKCVELTMQTDCVLYFMPNRNYLNNIFSTSLLEHLHIAIFLLLYALEYISTYLSCEHYNDS